MVPRPRAIGALQDRPKPAAYVMSPTITITFPNSAPPRLITGAAYHKRRRSPPSSPPFTRRVAPAVGNPGSTRGAMISDGTGTGRVRMHNAKVDMGRVRRGGRDVVDGRTTHRVRRVGGAESHPMCLPSPRSPPLWSLRPHGRASGSCRLSGHAEPPLRCFVAPCGPWVAQRWNGHPPSPGPPRLPPGVPRHLCTHELTRPQARPPAQLTGRSTQES